MGTTGSGKSSILDLLMGLLLPTSGSIKIDGKNLTPQNIYLWHKKISHVSQGIYFLDASIVENIALGIPENKVDWVKVKSVCQIAEIAEDIENLPQEYLSPMGENGELFSGGQRQRIALARALYRGSEVLLLDEATSALDVETESKVMQNLINYSSDTTIIMVAHRTAVLEFCNKLFKVKKGRIVESEH
jgi:ATP-binding cassette subfamily B protein